MNTTSHHRTNHIRALCGGLLVVGVSSPALADGGKSPLLPPPPEVFPPTNIDTPATADSDASNPTAIVVYPPTLTFSGVTADEDPEWPALDATPLPMSKSFTMPTVLLASGSEASGYGYDVYFDGHASGRQALLLPRTRAGLAGGWHAALNAEREVVADIEFSAELSTATLVYGGSSRHVLAVLATHVVHPVADVAPFTLRSATVIGLVTDMQEASDYVLQVEEWLTFDMSEFQLIEVIVPHVDPPSVEACEASCAVIHDGAIEYCDFAFKAHVDAIFDSPYGTLDVLVDDGRGDVRASRAGAGGLGNQGGVEDQRFSELMGITELIADFAAARAPSMSEALQFADSCHQGADQWFCGCKEIACGTPCSESVD